jgi:hypothetical protein
MLGVVRYVGCVAVQPSGVDGVDVFNAPVSEQYWVSSIGSGLALPQFPAKVE